MRKIESELRDAIRDFRPFHKGNTAFVKHFGSDDIWALYLHGNHIATFNRRSDTPTIPTEISLAGWNSNTTRSRLNALDGVSVHTKNFTPYLNGHEISVYGQYDPKTGMLR